MSYMVLYTAPDGHGAFGRCDELTDAVAEVERLRNGQGVEDARIFRLEEVKFEMKPYFRVEIPGGLTDVRAAPETALTSAPFAGPLRTIVPWQWDWFD